MMINGENDKLGIALGDTVGLLQNRAQLLCDRCQKLFEDTDESTFVPRQKTLSTTQALKGFGGTTTSNLRSDDWWRKWGWGR
jgi:hypothetical protein